MIEMWPFLLVIIIGLICIEIIFRFFGVSFFKEIWYIIQELLVEAHLSNNEAALERLIEHIKIDINYLRMDVKLNKSYPNMSIPKIRRLLLHRRATLSLFENRLRLLRQEFEK